MEEEVEGWVRAVNLERRHEKNTLAKKTKQKHINVNTVKSVCVYLVCCHQRRRAARGEEL